MRLINKKKLEKFKRKNRGNQILSKGIIDLIDSIESNNWNNELELTEARIDADCVHNDGFYFFDITRADRTMILVEFDENEATVVWVGNHADYISTFKNNKNTIKTWLRSNDWIE
jgi:mRNA interferase HigB